MPEQKIEIGQLWESRDWRDANLMAWVVEVDEATGFATIQRKVRSKISFRTLRKRYRLVQQPLEET